MKDSSEEEKSIGSRLAALRWSKASKRERHEVGVKLANARWGKRKKKGKVNASDDKS